MEETKKDYAKIILRYVAIINVFIFITTLPFLFLFGNLNFFSDFAETISYCISTNPYSGVDGIHSIYPPFAFLPFYLFALICKTPLENYLDGTLSLYELSRTPSFVVSFIIFFIICMTLNIVIATKMSKFKGEKLFTLIISIIFSAPVLYCFIRGNNIISVATLVLLFFWLYNSEKRWQREIANLCLACAIGIKIYPAFILLFFIKDRRWLDMLKTFLYSIVLLFIPFLLIDGGFGNIKYIWKNFTVFNSGQGRDANLTNISLDSLASKFSTLIGTIFSFDASAVHSILSKITRFGMLIATVVVFAICKKSKTPMQVSAVSVLTYLLFQGVSYAYTLTLFLFPMLLYIFNFDTLSKTNKWYYGICFACILVPISVNLYNFILPSIVCVCILVKSYVDIIKGNKSITEKAESNPAISSLQ